MLEDRDVIFSGYRVPHPLEPAIQVKVQTRSDNPGPVQAVQAALSSLSKEFDEFEKRFDEQLKTKAVAPKPGASAGDGFEPMMMS